MEQKLASRFVHTPSRLRTPVPNPTIPANIPNIVFTSCGPRKIQSGKCGNTFEGERIHFWDLTERIQWLGQKRIFFVLLHFYIDTCARRRWMHNAIRDRVIHRVKRVNRRRETFKEIKPANRTIQIDISTVSNIWPRLYDRPIKSNFTCLPLLWYYRAI